MNMIHSPGRLDQLDLNLFRVFDVVYRERSLSRAAGELSLTQSAVSHALGRLRAKLADPLFTRQGRGVEPTALAIQLAPAVREALEVLERAVITRAAFDPGRDLRRLSVGMPDELEPMVLPRLFERLRRASPASALVASRLERTRMRSDLASGRLDVALDVAHPVNEEVLHERVFSDTFCVVVRPGRRVLEKEAYLAMGHVAVSSRRTGPVLEDSGILGAGRERHIAVRCQRYETALYIVAASDLAVTIPRYLGERLAGRLGLSVFDLPLSVPGIDVHLYWHRRRDEDAANRWIREGIRQGFAR